MPQVVTVDLDSNIRTKRCWSRPLILYKIWLVSGYLSFSSFSFFLILFCFPLSLYLSPDGRQPCLYC